jgi:putative peptidoglycan lipid II flippase
MDAMATDAAQKAPAAQQSFLGHAKVISVLTLISRVFGQLRETILTMFLGTGVAAIAFRAAFAVPNMFRKLFGEGALAAAFIPLYSKALKENSTEEARAFAAASVNLLTLILIAITIIGEAILVSLILFTDPQRESFVLILKLSAIMLPYVVLICLTAFLSGILQVHRHFALPAAAPILLNVIHIAVTSFGGIMLGITATADPLVRLSKQVTLTYWLAGMVLVAGAAQVALLLPALKKVGFRFSLHEAIWTPQIRHMLKMSIPIGMAAGVLQISVLMDKGISAVLAQDINKHTKSLISTFSLAGQDWRLPMQLGALARLDMAQMLYQFPLGIFAIALATAIFPGLSSDALDKDQGRFKSTLRIGIEATLFEGLAASVGLIIVRYQAIRVLLKYGTLNDDDVQWIARSLAIYASGIWAYSMQQIINRAYYALHDTRTPFVMSILNIAINLVVEIPLLWTDLGESGMAVGTTVSFAVQSLLMLCLLRKRIGGLGLASLSKLAMKMLVAAGLMWLACWGIQHAPFWPHGSGKIASLMQLGLLMGLGGGVYLGACQVMGVRTLRELLPRSKRTQAI